MIRDRITRCVDSLDPVLKGLGVLGASNEGKHTYRGTRCLAYSLLTALLLGCLNLFSLILGDWCSGSIQSINDMTVRLWGGPINAALVSYFRIPPLWFITAGFCAVALYIQSWSIRRGTGLSDAGLRSARVSRLNALIIAPPLWLIGFCAYTHPIWLSVIRGWESHPIRCIAALAAWGLLAGLAFLWLTEVGTKFFKDQAESLIAQRAREAASASPLCSDDQAS